MTPAPFPPRSPGGGAEPPGSGGTSAPPRVVALMPVWRAAAFVEATLDALAAQTWPALEVLISDDASPDDTAAICERRAARDPRFRVIRQPRNLGWVGNVNALLRTARGDCYVFAFQDDLFEPDYVARCVAALEARPQAILAFSDVALVEQDGRCEIKRFERLERATTRLERARPVARLEGSWWIPNRGVFRAPAARAIGGLRRHRAGEFSADWPWLLAMSLLGEMVRVPEVLVTKIYQPHSLSRTWRFGVRAWSGVAWSAAGGVWRARIPMTEKLALTGAIAGVVLGRIAHRLRRAPGRALRRLGPGRSAATDEGPAR